MKRRQGTAKPIPVGLALGLCVSAVITLCGSAITAYLVSAEKMDTEWIGYAALGILILASAAGAGAARKSVKVKALPVCAMMAGAYYLSLAAATALFFGGEYQGMGVTAICVLVGSGIAFLLTGIKKGTGKSRRKIGTYR